MTEKNRVKIAIGGKTFTIMGYETEGHIKNVGEYIDEKLREIKSNTNRSLDASLAYVLTSINVADDYFKEVEKNKELKNKISSLEQEVRELRKKQKHKLQAKKGAHQTSSHQEANAL